MSKKEKTAERASEFAKNVWLAGLGAYGKAFDEASEKYGQASKEVPKLFKDLVAKGAKLEKTTRDQLNHQISEPLSKTSASIEHKIEQKIEKVRRSLGMGNNQADITRLEAKVDQLQHTVDSLLKQMRAKTVPTAAKKKAKTVKTTKTSKATKPAKSRSKAQS